MRVERIEQQTAPDFGTKYKFKVTSPVFVKGKQPADGKPPHHYLWNEPEADALDDGNLNSQNGRGKPRSQRNALYRRGQTSQSSPSTGNFKTRK